MQTESVFGDPGLWALIGMAAMMGGTMRSPLTAMIFAVELTRDFNLFPALLIGSIAALGVTMLLMRRSILTEKFTRRGHHITREYSIDPFELARARCDGPESAECPGDHEIYYPAMQSNNQTKHS
jgi:CIC family chloride channel protein